MRSSDDPPHGLPYRRSVMRFGLVTSAARILRDFPITSYSESSGTKCGYWWFGTIGDIRASGRLVAEVAAARAIPTASSRRYSRAPLYLAFLAPSPRTGFLVCFRTPRSSVSAETSIPDGPGVPDEEQRQAPSAPMSRKGGKGGGRARSNRAFLPRSEPGSAGQVGGRRAAERRERPSRTVEIA